MNAIELESNAAPLSERTAITEDEFSRFFMQMNEKKWENLIPPQIAVEMLSSKSAERLITPASVPVPDCQSCGACCSKPFVFAPVYPSDATAAEHCWTVYSQGARRTYQIERCLRRDEQTGTCLSLAGEIGNQVGCRIYEQRPHPCREFEAGSDKCHALRRAYNIEPLLDEAQVAAAFEKLRGLLRESEANQVLPEDNFSQAVIIENPQTEMCEIIAVYKDESFERLYCFDPERETWSQSRLMNRTLGEIKALIAAAQN